MISDVRTAFNQMQLQPVEPQTIHLSADLLNIKVIEGNLLARMLVDQSEKEWEIFERMTNKDEAIEGEIYWLKGDRSVTIAATSLLVPGARQKISEEKYAGLLLDQSKCQLLHIADQHLGSGRLSEDGRNFTEWSRHKKKFIASYPFEGGKHVKAIDRSNGEKYSIDLKDKRTGREAMLHETTGQLTKQLVEESKKHDGKSRLGINEVLCDYKKDAIVGVIVINEHYNPEKKLPDHYHAMGQLLQKRLEDELAIAVPVCTFSSSQGRFTAVKNP